MSRLPVLISSLETPWPIVGLLSLHLTFNLIANSAFKLSA